MTQTGSDDAGIDITARPSGPGCLECEETGSWWLHLRRCAECGHIGCCDSSLNKHGTAHWRQTGHPVIQSFEPGEDWFYSFETLDTFDGPELAEPRHHPLTQSTPGPADRVPADWQTLLG